MVKSARAKLAQRDPAAGPVLPEDLVLWEIFYRLPPKEILRCRAVSRSWRRLACDAEFLHDHHRRQPSLPLVLFNEECRKVPATVDSFDLRQSPAVRRPILGFSSHDECRKYYIHASCDGLLLLSRTYRLYYICNPATRQWCALPDVRAVTALYHHRPSGEYRVLYCKYPTGAGTVYYVLTVGSSLEGQRCIGLRAPSGPSPSVEDLVSGCILDYHNPPVPLRDCLHWHYWNYRALDPESKVIVFDTVDESFRCMRSPIAGKVAGISHLRQMDGTLGIHQVDHDTMIVRVWTLQDYEMEVWSLKHIIQLPLVEMMKYDPQKRLCLISVSENGDMLVISQYARLLFHFDSKGNLVDKFEQDFVTPRVLSLPFKESLVWHAFFERKDRKRVKLQSFFRGL